jgi:hypothetical protein
MWGVQTGLFKSPVQRNAEVLFASGVVYAQCAWRPVAGAEPGACHVPTNVRLSL